MLLPLWRKDSRTRKCLFTAPVANSTRLWLMHTKYLPSSSYETWSGVKYFKTTEQKVRRRGIFEDQQGQDYTGGTKVLPQNAVVSCFWCSCDRESLTWNDLLDQLDATIMIYWWINNSTCFGHHCAHLQECKAGLVHTTCLPASQDSCQHLKCWKPYAVVYSLALLKMGTMVSETCWVNDSSISHNCCIKLV